VALNERHSILEKSLAVAKASLFSLSFTLWFSEIIRWRPCWKEEKSGAPLSTAQKIREIFSRGQGFSILPLIYSLVFGNNQMAALPEGGKKRCPFEHR